MKLRTNVEVEVAGEVALYDIKIGDKKYKLEIEQSGCNGNAIDLRFCENKTEGRYTIHIDERGLRLHRTILRPNHDHSDHEDMRLDDGVPKFCDKEYRKKGSLQYSDRELAWFEFGPTKVDY